MDAPGHDRIDGQAGFQTVCGAELVIPDLTAALEDAGEDLDAPAPGILLHALEGVGQAGITCPMLHLWAAGGPLDTFYEQDGGALGIWRKWADNVQGQAMKGGHFVLRKTPWRPWRFYIISYLLDVPSSRDADWLSVALIRNHLRTWIGSGEGERSEAQKQRHEMETKSIEALQWPWPLPTVKSSAVGFQSNLHVRPSSITCHTCGSCRRRDCDSEHGSVLR
jgi:hypothetical protein